MADQPKEKKINIELPEEVAEGVYSNLAIIAHSNSEFVLDFVRILPNMAKARVKSRIIITPEHAKRLVQALSDNLMKYEKQHGPVSEPDDTPFPLTNFTPTAEA